jgi:hypothetical protein
MTMRVFFQLRTESRLGEYVEINMLLAGRILIALSISLMFFAYSNFAPTALGSDQLADYVKNHFIREMIFGCTLALLVIALTVTAKDKGKWLQIAVLGSIVVLPFWVAWSFGWSVGGIEAVWGTEIDASGAYSLHIPQVSLFYLGLTLLWFSLPDSSS